MRRKNVENSFENAENAVIEKINTYSEKLSVESARKYVNEYGQTVMEPSHYSETENIIRMDENKDNEEYAEVFRHEMGHFIDAQMGRPSCNENFCYAVQADREWVQRDSGFWGGERIENMLEELTQTCAAESSYISDILDAMIYDQPQVRARVQEAYEEIGESFYGHEASYWKGETGVEHAVEREIFANMFALYGENNPQKIKFMESWFPNMSKRFTTEMEGNKE